MLRYFDYTCENGHVFEELVRDEERDNVKCPECQVQAKRMISPTTIKADGTDPNNTRAWLKWEKDHMKQLAWEKKRSYSEDS